MKVLMITGVYCPEINGAVLQCQQIINKLRHKVKFSILTHTARKEYLYQNKVNEIRVFRILGARKGLRSEVSQFLKLVFVYFKVARKFEVIHLHGFSRKSVIYIILAKVFRQKVILKMTSLGHDDPESIKKRSRFLFFFYKKVDSFIGISPIFKQKYQEMKLTSAFNLIPNGVDTTRFHSLSDKLSKQALRKEIGLEVDGCLILCVGHFSYEKGQNILLDAWVQLCEQTKKKSGIVYIGSTDLNSFEVDYETVDYFKKVTSSYLNKNIFHIEKTYDIEKYYKSCDVFVLPSLREGMPNVLLEAMACELPVISSKLPGITDWVINNNFNGFLYEPNDINQLSILLDKVISDENLGKNFGKEARKTIEKDFNIESISHEIYSLYEKYK